MGQRGSKDKRGSKNTSTTDNSVNDKAAEKTLNDSKTKISPKEIVKERLGEGEGEGEEEDEAWVKISARSYSVQDWQSLVASLLADTNLRRYAHAKPKSSLGSIDNLREYLKKCPHADSDTKKAWLVYLWITEFISYDIAGYNAGNLGVNTPSAVFNRGKCVGEGYSSLFQDLCKSVGLNCEQLSGYAKGPGYQVGDHFNDNDANHAWNVVKLDGKRQFVECAWGAGGYSEGGANFVKRFEPYYFCTPPQIFIFNHFPVDDTGMSQLLDQPITLDQFEASADFSVRYHAQGFECLSNKNGKLLIEAKTNPLLLEFKIPKNAKLMIDVKLMQSGKQLPSGNILLQYDRDGEKAAALIMFDSQNLSEKYSLNILSNSSSSSAATTNEYLAKFIVTRIGRLTKIPKYELFFGKQYQMECLSHKSLWIDSKENQIKMEFKYFGNNFMEGHLSDFKTGRPFPTAVLKQLNPSSKTIELRINLPEKDRIFLLRVDCRIKVGNSRTDLPEYAKFFISTMGSPRKVSFWPDFQFIKIEREECYVYEPLSYELKVNQPHQFKIDYKNADAVWLEDCGQKSAKYFKTTSDRPDIWILKASFAQPQDLELKIAYTTEIGQRNIIRAGSYKIVA